MTFVGLEYATVVWEVLSSARVLERVAFTQPVGAGQYILWMIDGSGGKVRRKGLSLELTAAFQNHVFKHRFVPASGGMAVDQLYQNAQVVF